MIVVSAETIKSRSRFTHRIINLSRPLQKLVKITYPGFGTLQESESGSAFRRLGVGVEPNHDADVLKRVLLKGWSPLGSERETVNKRNCLTQK